MKKNIALILFSLLMLIFTSCGSNSDNESLSNPRQTDDPNARNPEAEHIQDSMNNLSHVPGEMPDTTVKK